MKTSELIQERIIEREQVLKTLTNQKEIKRYKKLIRLDKKCMKQWIEEENKVRERNIYFNHLWFLKSIPESQVTEEVREKEEKFFNENKDLFF